MQVLLVQHGQAVPTGQHPDRPLSEAGRAEVQRVANHLAARLKQAVGVPITEVLHSGKLRAQQTAELLANRLAPGVTPRPADGLSPNDDPQIIADRLQPERSESSAVILVEHLPHLPRLVGLLAAGNADLHPVRFRNAGVVRLSWDQRWAVDWILWPELAV